MVSFGMVTVTSEYLLALKAYAEFFRLNFKLPLQTTVYLASLFLLKQKLMTSVNNLLENSDKLQRRKLHGSVNDAEHKFSLFFPIKPYKSFRIQIHSSNE
jgi:hypothetical protein